MSEQEEDLEKDEQEEPPGDEESPPSQNTQVLAIAQVPG